jgi:predicted lysophospholipase L1 biosynthesis ABC-type transport system permease subunit
MVWQKESAVAKCRSQPCTIAAFALARPMQLSSGMWRHSTGMVALFVVTVGFFALALVAGSTLLAFMALMGGLVVAFVLATAWMRPQSYPPEHHPKVDRLFDDTAP